MKRILASVTGTVAGLVLLLGFKTHSPETVAPAAGRTPGTATTSTSRQNTPTKNATTTSTTTKANPTTTYTGAVVSTRYGPVQVRITMNGSKLTKVDVLTYPQSNNRDVAINTRAVPQLTSQALSAQGANIDGVSGATYTTGGFIESLQSALSQATS
jgi:uncharacterized protein with FMN-binding domain